MASSIIKFLDEQFPAADHSQDIQVVPDAYRKRVKGIDIYFPKEDYSRTWDLFEKMQEITTVITHGSANVRSLFSDYRRGHIHRDKHCKQAVRRGTHHHPHQENRPYDQKTPLSGPHLAGYFLYCNFKMGRHSATHYSCYAVELRVTHGYFVDIRINATLV